MKLKWDKPCPYLDAYVAGEICTGRSLALANKLAAMTALNPEYAARISADLTRLVEHAANLDSGVYFGVPEIIVADFPGFSVALTFGVVVLGETRRGRLQIEFNFVLCLEDELEECLELFQLEKLTA